MYWKEIHAEAWRRTRETGFLEWKRLATSVVLPIVSGLIQLTAGVSVPVNLAVNITGGLLLYLLLVFVERFLHIRQIIVERDTSQREAIQAMDRQIKEKTRRISELETPAPTISVDFESAYFQYSPNPRNPIIILRMKLRSGDTPATLHGWALRFPGKPQIKTSIGGFVKTPGATQVLLYLRLEARDVVNGYLSVHRSGVSEAGLRELV